ncbi:MAG: DUF1592 domain-containing protein [Myxococcales bacterium]|nr:DUF1592 domain-containing protein [Myxococcales bacterium]
MALYGCLLLLGACGGAIDGDPANEPAAGPDGPDGSESSARPSADAPGSDGSDGDGPSDASGLDGQGNPRNVGFVCDPGAALPGQRVRRLTERQYRNTLEALLTRSLGDAGEARAVMDGLQSRLASLPSDERFRSAEDLHGSYRRLDQAVGQGHAEVWYRVGVDAGVLLSEPGRLSRLAGDCATDGVPDNDAACLDDFIESFGARALRRPLDADERAFYRDFYAADGGPATGEDPAGYADVIAGMLNAPQFLYLVEHGQDDAPAGAPPETFELTAFELAARLSYHFWDSMPDDALWEAAASGALLDDAEYEAQVERLFEDPRTRDTVREFHRDWLKLEDLVELDMNAAFAVFETFAGDDLPGPDLREQMIDEALDMLGHHVWEQGSDLSTILTSDQAYPRSDALASIYDLPVWDGTGEPPAFAADARPGLLSRAAFLATGSANTRPIMKGVFIRRNILCDTIPPPPDNAAANPPELSEDLSTREVVEELTEQDGSVCASCHAVNINPLGFATEGFDALGRAREEQMLLAEDGSIVGMAQLDTRSVPRIFPDDETVSEGAADLMALIADSGKAEACLARHYFRFTFGRFEDTSADGCVLETLRTAISEGGTVRDMLRAVALTPEFRQRSFATASQEAP